MSHNADPGAIENLKNHKDGSTAWLCTASYNSHLYGEQVIDMALRILKGEKADEKEYTKVTVVTPREPGRVPGFPARLIRQGAQEAVRGAPKSAPRASPSIRKISHRADGDLMSILAMKGIYKAFPGIVAVDRVDLSLEKGEVLALVGENGAGKSTLIKILSGAYPKDGGTIEIEGTERPPYNTREAIDLGIGIVYQELNYLGAMSIAENLFIGRVPTRGAVRAVDYPKLYRDAAQVMKQFGLDHRAPETPVEALSVAEKQLVEIARAFTTARSRSSYWTSRPARSTTRRPRTCSG